MITLNSKKLASTLSLALLVGSLGIASAADTNYNARPNINNGHSRTGFTISQEYNNNQTEGHHMEFRLNSGHHLGKGVFSIEGTVYDLTDLELFQGEDIIFPDVFLSEFPLMTRPRGNGFWHDGEVEVDWQSFTPSEHHYKMLQRLAEANGIEVGTKTAEELQADLEKLGITLGFHYALDDEALKQGNAFFTGFQIENYLDLAERLGMELDASLSEEAIKEAVLAELKTRTELSRSENLLNGFSEGYTSFFFHMNPDLTQEERHLAMLTQLAEQNGIDPTGLSSEELTAALQEKGLTVQSRFDGDNLQFSMRNKPDHETCLHLAEKFGLNVEGMDDAEIMDAVEAAFKEQLNGRIGWMKNLLSEDRSELLPQRYTKSTQQVAPVNSGI